MKNGKAVLMAPDLEILKAHEPKPYFKIEEVSDFLGISQYTVRKRIHELALPLFTKGTNSRTKYVRLEDVDRIKELGDEYHPC